MQSLFFTSDGRTKNQYKYFVVGATILLYLTNFVVSVWAVTKRYSLQKLRKQLQKEKNDMRCPETMFDPPISVDVPRS